MLDAFAASFLTIFLSEFGDKSRLVAFTLSARFRAPLPVFAGMTLSYLLLDGIAVMFGSVVAMLIAGEFIRFAAGTSFIVFAALMLMGEEYHKGRTRYSTPFMASFLLTSVAEFGDKTQLLFGVLATKYAAMTVFVGGMLALTLLNIATVIFGSRITRYVSMRKIEEFSAVIFVVFGLAIIFFGI